MSNLLHSAAGHEACTDLGRHESDDNGKCLAVGLTCGQNSRYPSSVLEMRKSRKGTLTSDTFSNFTSQNTRLRSTKPSMNFLAELGSLQTTKTSSRNLRYKETTPGQ